MHLLHHHKLLCSNDDVPPPLPPHGVPTAISVSTTSATVGTAITNNVNNGNNEDYKPPVPPHRNTGVNVRLPEPPRKHRHRASSGGSGSHHGNNHRHSSKPLQQSNHNIVKSHGKARMENANNKQAGEDEEFVELVDHDDNRHHANDAGRSREIKRATIVGNPMFSSFSTSAVVSTVSNSSIPTGGTASSTTTSPPSSSPSACSSSSASSTASSSSQEQEESVALDDLNLGMDYNQIMQYFDNLKESNA